MGPTVTPPPLTPAALSRADGGRPPFSPADVQFMTGMIPHHAQAVLIAGWAAAHGASPAVRVLCERIVVAQRDEIAFMQRWLRERNQPVPPEDASHHMAAGADHALAPGMLTGEQLMRLDAARGAEFDRLFLMYMIQHHEGALTMVDRLFASQGAAQDDDVYKLAADIHADQVTEIERMQAMLAAMPSASRSP
ncbi:MAG TPA: DUF305 domain-containing protein [Gemmatimonadales bacterium]|nr:DUF305 domain-containing protein [Gemmatimonadales bacterium]